MQSINIFVFTQENPLFIISNVTVPFISKGNVEDGVGVNVAVTCGVIPVIEKSKPVLQLGVGVGVGLTGSAVRSTVRNCEAGEQQDFLEWFITLDTIAPQDINYVLRIVYYNLSSGEYFTIIVNGTILQVTSTDVRGCAQGGIFIGTGYFVVSTCVVSIGGSVNSQNFKC